MKYNYLVIEREYGSGGTKIGALLSEAAQIPCYGKEILEQLSEEFSVPVSQLEEFEEKATNSFLYSIYLIGKQMEAADDLLSLEGRLYVEEQRIIKEKIMQGPAVFVGRCAENALSDRDDVLKVFITADKSVRKKRAIEEYGIAKEMADSVLHKFDKKRSSFYHVNTGKRWKELSNYDLVLDSGKLGLERCVSILQSAMKG